MGARPLPKLSQDAGAGYAEGVGQLDTLREIEGARVDLAVEFGQYGHLKGAGGEEYCISVVLNGLAGLEVASGHAHHARDLGNGLLQCHHVRYLTVELGTIIRVSLRFN